MKVVVLQSNYIPWRGYFDLIHDADLFIFYDEVQYTKNDWRNRNRIYTRNGLQWLTIPVGLEATRGKISEVRLNDHRWQRQHYKALQLGYGRAPYFHQAEPLLREVLLETQWTSLSQVNRFLIERISALLGITTKFADSAAYHLDGDRVGRLLKLLKDAGATEYISGPAAKAYLHPEEHLFAEQHILLHYKDYSGYPSYTQLRAPFEPAVSIIDLLVNVELKEIKNYIWGWRQ